MATSYPLNKLTGFRANADLSSYQFMYVCLNSSGLVIAGVTDQKCGLGILLNKPSAQYAACEIAGPGSIVGAVSGAATAIGDKLQLEVADAGKLIVAGDDTVVCALALEVGADGVVTEVLIETPHLCADVSDEGTT